jgi:serine O-acetyltransferase
MLKDLRDDYERHGRTLRNPALWLIAIYRYGRWAQDIDGPLGRLAGVGYCVIITGAEFLLGSSLHRETEIGAGLHIIHADGIRIAPNAVIGDRVGIMHGVVIGTSPDRAGVPVIGDDAFIGAGAKILGPVTVGARARVAANSLVISDVPPDTTAIGVPARIVRYTGRPVAAVAAERLPSAPPERLSSPPPEEN